MFNGLLLLEFISFNYLLMFKPHKIEKKLFLFINIVYIQIVVFLCYIIYFESYIYLEN